MNKQFELELQGIIVEVKDIEADGINEGYQMIIVYDNARLEFPLRNFKKEFYGLSENHLGYILKFKADLQRIPVSPGKNKLQLDVIELQLLPPYRNLLEEGEIHDMLDKYNNIYNL